MTGDRDFAKEYTDLRDRLTDLRQQHAVLAAKEAERKSEREKLETELKAAGIDVTDLESEADRLRLEISTALQEAESSISQFSQQLSNAEDEMAGTKKTDPEIEI